MQLGYTLKTDLVGLCALLSFDLM